VHFLNLLQNFINRFFRFFFDRVLVFHKFVGVIDCTFDCWLRISNTIKALLDFTEGWGSAHQFLKQGHRWLVFIRFNLIWTRFDWKYLLKVFEFFSWLWNLLVLIILARVHLKFVFEIHFLSTAVWNSIQLIMRWSLGYRCIVINTINLFLVEWVLLFKFMLPWGFVFRLLLFGFSNIRGLFNFFLGGLFDSILIVILWSRMTLRGMLLKVSIERLNSRKMFLVLRNMGMADMVFMLFWNVKMVLILTNLLLVLVIMCLNVVIDTTHNWSIICLLSCAIVVVDQTVERVLFLESLLPFRFLFGCLGKFFHFISGSSLNVIFIFVWLLWMSVGQVMLHMAWSFDVFILQGSLCGNILYWILGFCRGVMLLLTIFIERLLLILL